MRPPTRSSKSILLSGLFVFLLLASPVYGQDNGEAEIFWDAYGVPHVFAASAEGMFFGCGWSQMHAHANLILKLYAQARGRAAEYFGSEYYESDRRVQLFGLPERAERFYAAQPANVKASVDGFVRGMNAYAEAHPEAIDGSLRQVLPLKANDVLSHTLRIIWLEFLAGEDIGLSAQAAGAGSNAIALAPSRSASGNALLLINPHLPWSDYYLWFEAHLNSPDYSVYGVCLVGTPSITQGFNRHLGWAHTINPIDASDRYVLDVKNDRYRYGRKKIAFEQREVTLKVRQPDGSLLERKETFRYSVHGPVVASRGNQAWAVRIAGLDNTGILEEYMRMGSAKTFGEFESALKMMQIPMFNIIYADHQGNILYLFNGNIPRRSQGDFSFWKGTLDGSRPELVWTGTHPYADLPRVLNPPAGFIQNCNDAPWSCTLPFERKPEDYPPYFSSRSFSLRAQRATRMVAGTHRITFDQLIDYKNNTEMEAANRFLDDLLAAVRKYPDSLSTAAAAVLEKWDHRTENESRGAILFAAWWDRMKGPMIRNPWSPQDPLGTPGGLKDEKQAAGLLSEAAAAVMKQYGSLDVAWGEVHRLRGGGHDFPANGGPGDHYGLFRTLYYADQPDGKRAAMAGETFIAAVEFADTVHARVCLSYGNATQEGSPHRGDQLGMLSRKELRPALLERSEIMSQAVRTERLKIK